MSPPTFAVVILSARAQNVVSAVNSILDREPLLPRDRIIVVDDGAREAAEPALPEIRWISGMRPFVFARNANIGIREAGQDVILMNDDAQLLTPGGFSALASVASVHSTVGLCSAAIRGQVSNRRQIELPDRCGLRMEKRRLCFVCVYIPWRTYVDVGPLDERFVGYGFEDDDYSLRVLMADRQLAIFDGCVVSHDDLLASTFRSIPDVDDRLEYNRQLFHAKLTSLNSARALVENLTPDERDDLAAARSFGLDPST